MGAGGITKRAQTYNFLKLKTRIIHTRKKFYEQKIFEREKKRRVGTNNMKSTEKRTMLNEISQKSLDCPGTQLLKKQHNHHQS